MLLLGTVLLIVFVCWENYAKVPLMPLQHWKNLNFSLVTAVSSCLTISR